VILDFWSLLLGWSAGVAFSGLFVVTVSFIVRRDPPYVGGYRPRPHGGPLGTPPRGGTGVVTPRKPQGMVKQ
jgi:hypothetical protein